MCPKQDVFAPVGSSSRTVSERARSTNEGLIAHGICGFLRTQEYRARRVWNTGFLHVAAPDACSSFIMDRRRRSSARRRLIATGLFAVHGIWLPTCVDVCNSQAPRAGPTTCRLRQELDVDADKCLFFLNQSFICWRAFLQGTASRDFAVGSTTVVAGASAAPSKSSVRPKKWRRCNSRMVQEAQTTNHSGRGAAIMLALLASKPVAVGTSRPQIRKVIGKSTSRYRNQNNTLASFQRAVGHGTKSSRRAHS